MIPDNRCMGCMKELDAGASVCPHCGFDKDKYVSPEMTLPPGSVLANGKYLIGKTLGQGGFGVTYIALDRFLKLRVAIKEYLPKSMAYRNENSMSLRWHSSMAEQNLGRDSFVKEAQKMAQMDDIPGIVRVREVFYENSTAYIVMDYVEGETLLQRLEKTGALDGKACFELLRPVMDSLAEAHQQGMIHRDISPDNIMLDKRGRVWLLDMGAAKEINVTQSGQSAHSSTVAVVKEGFSPLEQYASGPVTGKKDIGAWTDVYAMSATIFYCMSGSMLPPAPNRVLNPLLELPDIIPPNISQVLLKGLAVMPKERIRSMEELRDAFAAAVGATDEEEKHRWKWEEEERWKREEEEGRTAEEARRKAEEQVWQERQQAEETKRQEDERRQAKERTRQEAERRQAEEAERQRVERERQQAETAQQMPYQKDAQETAERPETLQRKNQDGQQPQKKRTAKNSAWAVLVVIAAVVMGIAFSKMTNFSPDTPFSSTSNIASGIVNSSNKNLKWKLDENGLLTISGSGEMDYSSAIPYPETPTAPWYRFRKQIISVEIQDGITSIDTRAFYDCQNLTSVTIPDSVVRLRDGAFLDCYNLSRITIPNGETIIGWGTFAGCKSLTEVVIPDSVTSIGVWAFNECESLTSVTIPDSVTTLDGESFKGCSSLSSVTMPDSMTDIDEGAFAGCYSLSHITIHQFPSFLDGPPVKSSKIQPVMRKFTTF